MKTRREFLRHLGVSSAALPFLSGLPGLNAAEGRQGKRLIIMFSPNGTIPWEFWPEGETLDFKRILKPLEPFKDNLVTLRGVHNKVEGDGDRHMRGMSCLLTGTELLPGNIQGGSDTPAGWASGISIDQEIKNFLQSRDETRTRFGSLEFGVAVPNRADPWTRMSYAGPNQPIAPVDDPEQMLGKLYGRMKDKESLTSIIDGVRDDLAKVSKSSVPKTASDSKNTSPSSAKWRPSSSAETKTSISPTPFPRSIPTSNSSTTTPRASAACRSTCSSTPWPTT